MRGRNLCCCRVIVTRVKHEYKTKDFFHVHVPLGRYRTRSLVLSIDLIAYNTVFLLLGLTSLGVTVLNSVRVVVILITEISNIV